MATMSFKKTAEEVKQAKEENTELVPVEQQPLAIAAPDVTADVVGEFGIRDVKLPRVQIIQKISDDSSVFGAGAIVFNREVRLATEGQKIEVTFIRLRKQYEEKLAIGSERMPAVYDTAEQVIAAGGSLQYGDQSYFQEVAQVQMVIRKPDTATEQESLLFPYEAPDGKWYAMAMWGVRSTAYTPVVPTLYTASRMFLSNGLYNGNWELSTEKRTNLKGSWHVPAIKFLGQHNDSMKTFMGELRGA